MNNVSSSNSQKGLVPELRFPEFRDEWKKEKLSDFVVRVTRKNKDNQSNLPLTISSKDGLVDQVTYFNKKVSSKDMSGYYLLKNGEFAYNKSYSVGYDFGSIKRLDMYGEGALSTLYICFALKKHNSDFIKTYFDSLKWYKEIYMIAAEGARNHGLLNVPTEDFFDTVHALPKSIDEQTKIADFLTLLEQRILKQKKLVNTLKLYKRGVENLYFSKKYNNHCRLKDILIERNEKSVKNNEHDVISSTKNGLFKQCDYFNKQASSEDTTGYKIIRLEQIVFSPQNLWMGNINYNDSYDIGIVSPSYKIFDINDGFDKYYIACLLKSSQAIKEYILASEQGASIVRRNLNMELFLQVAFFMPDLEEQIKISKHLKLLSNQLDNQEHTLKALLTMKQGLLQKMFI